VSAYSTIIPLPLSGLFDGCGEVLPCMPLSRERLTTLLAVSALTSVELVIAPPGYGKTTVLHEYAAADPWAVFISLPEATDLEAFVHSVITAAAPSALHSIGALFDGTSEQSVEERVADWLVSRLRAFNGTLIVDDFHRSLADERVARVLVATIAATHGRMRWIVASRESPPFPMGSWLARGWMGLPITSDDLGFTIDEAAALAASLDIPVGADDLAAIIDETLGWPIGVRLALSLVNRKRAIGQTRVQTREALFSLLADEVWKPLDADLRELIAAAAMMPAPAIETLVSAGFLNAGRGMAQVFTKIPFIYPIDDNAFAIHDLFREFVASQRSHAHPVDGTDVAERMGTALAAAGNPAEGLRLLIGAGNIDGTRETLARHAFNLFETGQRSVLTAALAFLSDNGLGDDGVALAIRGVLAYSDGSADNAANLFARSLQRDVPVEMRCEITRRLAVNYFNRGNVQAALEVLTPALDDGEITGEEQLEIRAFHTATRAAAGENHGIASEIERIEASISSTSPAWQARILQRLATAAFYLGDLDGAERYAHNAARLAVDLSMDTLAALCYAMLYNVAGHADENARRARVFLSAQAAAAERAANTALHVYALRSEFALAAVNGEIDNADKADAMLGKLVDARAYRDTVAIRMSRALLYVVSGEIRKAEATLKTAPAAFMTPSDQAFRDSLLIVLMLARGDREGAGRALEPGLLFEAATDYLGRAQQDYAYTFRAVAFWMLDRPVQARKLFAFDATLLPQRDRILVEAFRALTEFQHPLPHRNAVDAICRRLEEADFTAYAVLVRRLVGRDANEIALSATEIETLRVFDRYGGRATDVAKALGKSKFTVQNQIQSAIRKIGCSGRAEALAYARQRGWLDATDG
jgi:ATP/maltotriose-dependent transcriptional regulator MalT